MKRCIDCSHNDNIKFLVAVIISIILGVFIISGLKDTGRVSASTSNQKYFICIEIGEGDTLWSIADIYISEEYLCVDDYIEEIKELNGLTNDKIYCGATLVVPYYAP